MASKLERPIEAAAASLRALGEFLRLEAAGGIVLIGAAVLALFVSNSPLAGAYDRLLVVPIVIAIGDFEIAKPLLLWINDGLMAVFFMLVGLEIKREVLEGELSDREQIALPLIAALGGFVMPAAIYAVLNWNAGDAINGWAIPAATDIAFALGILSLCGGRVPTALKMFLASLAIFDDLAAIIVIAIFYTTELSVLSLSLAAAGAAALWLLNAMNVTRIAAYVLVGVFIWTCVLKSGVHATLAGILVALAIPLRVGPGRTPPLRELEHLLHPWVAFMILPLFAFANAGVSFAGLGVDVLTGSVALGVLLGLFVGKQVGVFLSVWIAVKLGFGKLPYGTGWAGLYGVSLLTGIGFTMSLFIGSLAFEQGSFDYIAATRLGVLLASTLSAVLGFLVLRKTLAGAPPGGYGRDV